MKRVVHALVAVTLLLVACDSDPAPLGPPAPPAPGDDGRYASPEVPPGPGVTVGIAGAYTGYNPRIVSAGAGDVLVANQVLASPFVRDPGLRLLLDTDVMVSAESENPDQAGRQRVTYRIKPGVRWSDGEAWDCDDLYLTWLAENSWSVRTEADGRPRFDGRGRPDRYFAAARGNPAAPRSSAQCADSLTFVETYEQPFTDWRESFAGPAVLPAHVVERRTGTTDVTTLGPRSPAADLDRVAAFWQTGWTGFDPATMPASGPYRIESWVPGNTVRLTPNPFFAGRQPGPSSLTIRSVDAAGAADLLRSRTIDVLAIDPQILPNVTALRALQGLSSEVVGGGSFTHIAFNEDSPLGSDLAVRQAVAQCLDRAELADRLIRQIDPLVVPRGSLLFPPGDPGYRDAYGDLMVSNPDLAKFTLESGGWQLGPDAVYQRSGQRLRLPIVHDGGSRNLAVVELIRTRCREAGIEIVGEPDPAVEERIRRGQFDAALLVSPTWPNRSAPRSTYTTTGRWNLTGLADPDVDVAWQEVAASSDPGRRVTLLREIDEAIAGSALDLPLFDVPLVVVHPPEIDGVSLQPVEGITWNTNAWRRR